MHRERSLHKCNTEHLTAQNLPQANHANTTVNLIWKGHSPMNIYIYIYIYTLISIDNVQISTLSDEGNQYIIE
jgi:hypothetical protein